MASSEHVEPFEVGASRAAGTVVTGLLSTWWRQLHPDVDMLAAYARDIVHKTRARERRHLWGLNVVHRPEIPVSYTVPSADWPECHDPAGTLQDIYSYYIGLRSGRLAVLGTPGSGKSFLALRLMLDLLPEGVGRCGQPRWIPLWLHAATWDADPILERWLARHLRDEYRLPRHVAERLAEDETVVPVIDGLDELDPVDAEPSRARQLLDRLNGAGWRGRPAVLTCRADVYARVRDLSATGPDVGLENSAAITVRPLTPHQTAASLVKAAESTCGDDGQWAPVTQAVTSNPGGGVATALSSPWLLTLAEQFLRKGDKAGAEELAACSSEDEVQNALFADLTTSAVSVPPAGKRTETARARCYERARVDRWLRTLAHGLSCRRQRGQDGSNIAPHEFWRILHEVPSRRAQTSVATVVFATAVVLGPTAIAYGGGWLAGQALGTPLAIGAAAALCGLVFGMVFGLTGAVAPGLVPSVVFAATGGLEAGLASGFSTAAAFGEHFGLLTGLQLGFYVAGASLAFSGRPGFRSVKTPGALLAWLEELKTLARTRRNPSAGRDVATGRADERTASPAAKGRGDLLVSVALPAVSLGLFVGAVTGLAAGTQSGGGDTGSVRGAVALGIVAAVVSALPAGVVGWLRVRLWRKSFPEPLRVLRSEALLGLAVGVPSALLAGVAVWLASGAGYALTVGVLIALTTPLLTSAASVRFACACAMSTLLGTFPARPVRFMRWAYEAGLCRVAGGAYQFRHETYQAWLARQDEPALLQV
jgi:hypothetical protein